MKWRPTCTIFPYNEDVRLPVATLSASLLLMAEVSFASEEAPMFPQWGEGAEPADTRVGESWMSLSRFQRLWQREGLGARGGTALRNAYVAASDGGDEVVAIDAASGRDLWRVAMPSKIMGHASMLVLGDSLFVMHGVDPKGSVRVRQLGVAGRAPGALSRAQLGARQRDWEPACG